MMNTNFIEIIKNPDKLSYEEGESFDLTGALIEAEYDNGNRYDITDIVTVTPEVITLKDKCVVIHFIGEVDTEEKEFTVTLPITVYAKSAWKFLDGAGLQYFYSLLLNKFMHKSSAIDVEGGSHTNKVMVFDGNGDVSYVDVTLDDILYLKDIASLLPDTEENKNFINLIDFVDRQCGYLKDVDIAEDTVIQNILNDEFEE